MTKEVFLETLLAYFIKSHPEDLEDLYESCKDKTEQELLSLLESARVYAAMQGCYYLDAFFISKFLKKPSSKEELSKLEDNKVENKTVTGKSNE